jgi:serine/threonine protein kinase
VKQGQVLRGYRVVTKPTNADAGKCLWAFAEKDGEEFFIKEFLDPKRPKPDTMGTVADTQRRLAECERFERRHRQVAALLREDHLRAGNLVLTRDFFAEGTRYYKVTKCIRGVDVRPQELEPPRQLLLLRTLVESLRLLHECGIVHGDLKPENVLLYQPRRSDLYTAKLIDFDDAYPAGDPPARDLIGGNPRYGAPEWLLYLGGDRSVVAEQLTTAVDMFAFGLLIHTYLCGTLPAFADSCDSPAAAVVTGAPLIWDPWLDKKFVPLLRALTDADPTSRPDAVETSEVLAGKDFQETTFVSRCSRVRSTFGRTPEPGRLRINLNGHRS